VRARLLRPDWHLTTDLLVGFRTDWPRREEAMKTAGRENPNRRDRLCNEPSSWGGRPKPFLLNQGGWRSRKHPAEGRVFFLTSPFIELLRTWRVEGCELGPSVQATIVAEGRGSI
jgi:hypothetical protein